MKEIIDLSFDLSLISILIYLILDVKLLTNPGKLSLPKGIATY